MESQIANKNKLKNKNAQHHIPERMCVNCRCKKNKSDMIRVVFLDKKWQIDASGKIQTRGMYLCKDKQCIQSALKNKRLCKNYGQQFVDLLIEINSDNVK